MNYVLDRTDRFRITRSNKQALLPSRKCHDLVVRTFQCSPEKGQVRLPGPRTKERQPSDMTPPLRQGSKRRHTSHRPADQGSLVLTTSHVLTCKKDCRITACHRNCLINCLTISGEFYAHRRTRRLTMRFHDIPISRNGEGKHGT